MSAAESSMHKYFNPKCLRAACLFANPFAAAGPLHHYEQLNVSDCDSVVQDRGAARDFKISEPAL